MIFHITFLTRKKLSPLYLELARREICWLIKDQLIPGTPAGHAQLGFSFVRAQVRPFTFKDGKLFSSTYEETLYNETFIELRNYITKSEETGFIVPLRAEINLSPLIKRLAFSDCIINIPSPPTIEDTKSVSCTREFWTTFAEHLILQKNLTSVDKAIFNITHPYHEGCSASVTSATVTNLTTGKILETNDFYRHKIASTFAQIHVEENESIKLFVDRMKPLMNKVALLSLPGNKMNSVIKNTGALSGANVMLIFDNIKNTESQAGSRELIHYIRETIRIGDSHGLSLNLFLSDIKNKKVYLGLKKHPRDSRLDNLGPEFNPGHEIRRLKQVERVRNTHPGYKKGPYGNREVVKELSSGWILKIARPGFKDCEDFHVTVESPEGVEMDPYAGKSPNYEIILEEARRHLECSHSGAMWLHAVFHLWLADQEPHKTIKDFLKDYPECECMNDFRYDDEAFLWLLHYLFVEEDMNYRFWYHPPIRGLRYRKQGRDMPMNGILRVATNPSDEDLPQDTNGQTRQNGGLVGRPRESEFKGPTHLKQIFLEIINFLE